RGPAHEVRSKEETEVAARRRNIPSSNVEMVQQPVRTEVAPAKTIPARERGPVANPAEAIAERQPQTTRNEVRNPAKQKPTPNFARPEVENRERNEGRPETKGEKARSEPARTDAEVKSRLEAKPT